MVLRHYELAARSSSILSEATCWRRLSLGILELLRSILRRASKSLALKGMVERLVGSILIPRSVTYQLESWHDRHTSETHCSSRYSLQSSIVVFLRFELYTY